MAKIQTRKAVSMNVVLYGRLAQRCADLHVSIASVVGLLVEEWLCVEQVEGLPIIMPEPEAIENIAAKASPEIDRELIEARRESLRKTLDEQRAKRAAEKAAAIQADIEARGLESPCRREICAIVGLHPHDDPRHDRFKRGLPRGEVDAE